MDEEQGQPTSNVAVAHPHDEQIGSSFKGKILSCSFGIDKNQIQGKWKGDDMVEVEFRLSYSSKQHLLASVYYFACEEYDTLHNITTKLWALFGAEQGQHYRLEPGSRMEFRFSMKCDNLKGLLTQHQGIPKKGKQEPAVYPLILRLEPLCDGAPQDSPKNVLLTYLDIVLGAETTPSLATPVRRQKREVNQESFDLIDVFNAEEGAENLCLICMSEEPDCIIMPCRHMVVNLECAQQIDQKKDQFDCPLCRCRAEELIYVSKPSKEQSQSPVSVNMPTLGVRPEQTPLK